MDTDKQTQKRPSSELSCSILLPSPLVYASSGTFEVVEELLSPLLVNDQRDVVGLLPVSELQSDVNVQSESAQTCCGEQQEDGDEETSEDYFYKLPYFELRPRVCHCGACCDGCSRSLSQSEGGRGRLGERPVLATLRMCRQCGGTWSLHTVATRCFG